MSLIRQINGVFDTCKISLKLVTLDTRLELERFLNELAISKLYLGARRPCRYSKNRKAYGFAFNDGRVSWLYDDGVTGGEAKVSNLYKLLMVTTSPTLPYIEPINGAQVWS